MFKVTFAFEDGSVTERMPIQETISWRSPVKPMWRSTLPAPGTEPAGNAAFRLKNGELETKKTLHISDEEFEEGWRLACMSKIVADVEVLVPDIASAYKSRMKVADLSTREEIAIFENAKREIE